MATADRNNCFIEGLGRCPPINDALNFSGIPFTNVKLYEEIKMEITRNGSRPSAKARLIGSLARAHRPPFQASDPARGVGASHLRAWSAHRLAHPSLGQTLIVTSGCGLAQRAGGPIEEIRPGDVIWFPPGRSTGTAQLRRPPCRTSPFKNNSTARPWTGWRRSATSSIRRAPSSPSRCRCPAP